MKNSKTCITPRERELIDQAIADGRPTLAPLSEEELAALMKEDAAACNRRLHATGWARHRRQNIPDKIKTALTRAKDWMTTAQIKAATGIPFNSIGRHLRTFKETGQVESVKEGQTVRWRWVV